MLSLTGAFHRWEDVDPTIPASAVVFAYIYTDDDTDNFLSSQGTLDTSTGAFTVVVENVPTGESSLVLSFAILDSADAPPDMGTNTVYDYNVANVGCGNALTLTLEWDPRTILSEYDDSSSYYFATYMELLVTEPTGAELPVDESVRSPTRYVILLLNLQKDLKVPLKALSTSIVSPAVDNAVLCVCFLPIHSGHQVRWTYQPGSHRRKVTQDF